MSALCIAMLSFASQASAQPTTLEEQAFTRATQVEQQMIEWRRDIHQPPELGEQEIRTSKRVADHLNKLGLEVQTGIGRTGVVGILEGAKPGPTVALRADRDALPVKEPAGLPFASTARGTYHGQQVPVMHACGHDTHTAMLMATAQILAGMRDSLPGKVMFIFQKANISAAVMGDDRLQSPRMPAPAQPSF